MKTNFQISKTFKELLKRLITYTYEKYNLGRLDDYRNYHNLKLKIISQLDNDSICIDIGCNNGEILAEIIKYTPKVAHYAFEPIPELANNLIKKFGSTIKVFNLALSDKIGVRDFNFVVSNPAYSGFNDRSILKNEQVKVIRVETNLLDNIVPETEKIKLIKIDVEGAEYFVLKGAVETLKRNKPIVLFEFGKGGSDSYNVTAEEVFDLFEECGLQVSLMEYFLYNRSPLDRHEFIGQFNKGYNYEFVAYAD